MERLDQVLMTFLLLVLLLSLHFFRRLSSTKGPFLSDLGTLNQLVRLRMNLSVRLFFLVFPPLADLPQGETGCLPPLDLPSPPP